MAIVLEVPNALLGEGQVAMWSSISLYGHAAKAQVSRSEHHFSPTCSCRRGASPSSSATTGLVCGWQASWVLPKSGWDMLAAASVELSDLVWVTSPSIPEWPRIDDAVGRALSGGGRARVASPLRSGIGVCRGRLLFELEGDKPQQVVAAQAFSKPRNDADALPIANPTHTARPGSYRVHLRLGCQDNHHTAGRGSVWRSMVRPFSCCPVSCM